jgi:hypothetical protein
VAVDCLAVDDLAVAAWQWPRWQWQWLTWQWLIWQWQCRSPHTPPVAATVAVAQWQWHGCVRLASAVILRGDSPIQHRHCHCHCHCYWHWHRAVAVALPKTTPKHAKNTTFLTQKTAKWPNFAPKTPQNHRKIVHRGPADPHPGRTVSVPLFFFFFFFSLLKISIFP